MKLNLTLASRHIKSLYIDTSLLKKQSLSDLLIWHSRTKCFSSSISLQMGHFLSATGVLGLVCLPLSISSICELQRNFAIECNWILFNTKMPSYQYMNSHGGDKALVRPRYLHNGIFPIPIRHFYIESAPGTVTWLNIFLTDSYYTLWHWIPLKSAKFCVRVS